MTITLSKLFYTFDNMVGHGDWCPGMSVDPQTCVEVEEIVATLPTVIWAKRDGAQSSCLGPIGTVILFMGLDVVTKR